MFCFQRLARFQVQAVEAVQGSGRSDMWCREGRDGGGTKAKSHLVLDMLLSTVDRPNAHNYALLLLWASQSNAIPVSILM